MGNEESDFDRLLRDIKTVRDELRVRLHLASAELQDEWRELEQKWETLKPKLETIGSETAATSRRVASALSLAAEEIINGYRRLRQRLK